VLSDDRGDRADVVVVGVRVRDSLAGQAALPGLNVIPVGYLTWAAVDLLPCLVQCLVQVITLVQGHDYCQAGLCRRGPEAAELTKIIRWCMGVTDSKIMNQ
jgi:hypothetical protein